MRRLLSVVQLGSFERFLGCRLWSGKVEAWTARACNPYWHLTHIWNLNNLNKAGIGIDGILCLPFYRIPGAVHQRLAQALWPSLAPTNIDIGDDIDKHHIGNRSKHDTIDIIDMLFASVTSVKNPKHPISIDTALILPVSVDIRGIRQAAARRTSASEARRNKEPQGDSETLCQFLPSDSNETEIPL